MGVLTLFSFLSGILIFIFGIINAGRHFQNSFGLRFKHYFSSLSSWRLRGLVSGFLLTLITQSSSASTVLIITFITSGLLGISQALATTLGAGVAASLMVQVIAFRIYEWAAVIAGVGIIISLASRSHTTKNLGQGIFFFALIFMGMQIMVQSLAPVTKSEALRLVFASLDKEPALALVLSLLVTAILQNSTAMLGLVLSFAYQNLLSMPTLLMLILGANIGTCSMALISSMTGNAEARRVAVGFLITKTVGVILIFPWVNNIAALITATGIETPRALAHFHLLFNIMLVFIFTPFLNQLAWFLEWAFPQRIVHPGEFRPQFLDVKALGNPHLALANAAREVLRMAEIVRVMLKEAIDAFPVKNPELIAAVESKENQVDLLNREIKLYLTQLSRTQLNQRQSHREMELLTFTINLEHISDIIHSSLMFMARKKINFAVEFSPEGWADIISFHRQVTDNFDLVLCAFTEEDFTLAQQVLQEKKKLDLLELGLRQAHIYRLHRGLAETIESSSLHLDILSDLKRINSFISDSVYPIVEKGDPRLVNNGD